MNASNPTHRSRLSVIIPSLNEARNIPALLEALKSQTYPPHEIIIADAGSTDNTIDLAQAHGVLVVSGGKPGTGRNAGARAASGDVFLFLDADVLPKSDFLELALDELEKDQYAVATCLTEALSDDLSDKILMDATNLYMQIIMPVSPRAPGFCIFARRAMHEAIGGFDETLIMSEDHDYVRRASEHGKFGLITSARIPVSMRRLEKEGIVGLALKYLWCEIYALAGKPIRSLPFEYEFGTYRPEESSAGKHLIDIAELRELLGHFDNPLQALSDTGLQRIEKLIHLDWLSLPRDLFHLQIESPDASILQRYLDKRLALIHRLTRLRSRLSKIKELPRESIRVLEAYLPWAHNEDESIQPDQDDV